MKSTCYDNGNYRGEGRGKEERGGGRRERGGEEGEGKNSETNTIKVKEDYE